MYTQLIPGIISELGNSVLLLLASASGGGYPEQEHHFASNKHHSKYTPKYEEIADRYGLDLDEAWNKEMIPQNGSHPTEYHEFVYENMKRAADEAGDSKDKFLELFEEYVKKPVRENPGMLDKAWWQQ